MRTCHRKKRGKTQVLPTYTKMCAVSRIRRHTIVQVDSPAFDLRRRCHLKVDELRRYQTKKWRWSCPGRKHDSLDK